MKPSINMADAIAAARGVLEGRAEVRLAYLFGSTARGEDRRSSDLKRFPTVP